MAGEGDQAPDFTLETDDGATVRLGDFRGRPLILYFYPKDDTSGCTKEALAFSALAEEFAARGAAVVGVSPDTPASHEKFKAKHGLNVRLASDTQHTVASAYGVWVEKSMYGRKFMGVERSTFLIDGDGRIARAWRKVKVPGHAEEVLGAVDALG
jgi:peroxiredoxin Q/BCP